MPLHNRHEFFLVLQMEYIFCFYDRAIFPWPWKMVSVSVICFISQWLKRSKHGLFVFPQRKPLYGQSCCSVTSKRSIDWFLECSRAWSFFTERSLNQSKATRVWIRSINQSNRCISVRLLFLFCSRVFISRSYENRSMDVSATQTLTPVPGVSVLRGCDCIIIFSSGKIFQI